MSNVLLFLIILTIITAVTYTYLKEKQIRRISDIMYRNLVDEITFYTSIDALKGIKGDLLAEERVIEGTWYWYFAYDSDTGFGCFMPMNTLSVEPDFSEVLDNVQRSYLMGRTKNGILEEFNPIYFIRDWCSRK